MKKNFLQIKGFVFVFLAVAVFSLQSIIARVILIAGVDPTVLASVKLFSGLTVMSFIFLILKKKLFFKVKDVSKWLFFGIFGGTIFAIALGNSYNLLGASQGVIYLYTAPAFTLIFASLYLKEKLSVLKLISVVLILIGTVFVAVGAKGSSFSFNLIGFLFGILSGVTYGIFSIFGKKMSYTYDSWNINFFYVLISSLAIAPITPFLNWRSLLVLDYKLLIILFLSGFLVYGIGNIFFMKSFKYLEAGEVMIFANLEPMMAVILASTILNETLTVLQLFGFVFILIAIFLISILNKNNI